MPVMEEGNEVLERVRGIRRSFDDLVNNHSDDANFTDSVKAALDAAEFPPEEKIRQEYAKSADSARLLRIGIVGAVKAGKSSLLNSLFFDGQDILPKAATPMTAALTEMTFGEKCSVTVDFFTDQDIEELKRKSAEYERRFTETRNRKAKEMEENWRRAQKRRNPMFSSDPGAKEREQWEKLSKSAAQTELKKNVLLSGGFEQYEMIRKSAAPRKTGSETFTVSDVSGISSRLEDYVGAEGRYMPFTSKVSITLPLESLRGIEVVDTPGFNDPVPSRDERARLALRECDVIFILSRATPFLTRTDMEVISKITQKNGLREIYIVPSQVDSSLIAPEIIRDSDGDMYTALDNVREILSDVVSRNLRGINEGGVFDQLINEAQDRMFPTSGICESMARTFAEREGWDSGKKTVWQNLRESYPDFFSDYDEDTSVASLQKLGNTQKIRDAIDDVSSRKEEIFRDRLEKFGSKYAAAAKQVRDSVIKGLDARVAEIQKNDIAQAEALIKQLNESYDTLAPELDDVFEETVSEWYDKVRDEYQGRLSDSRGTVNEAMRSQEGETTHTWTTREESKFSNLFGLLADDIHHSETLTTVNASAVKNAIYDYVDEYNDFLPHFFNSQVRVLVRKVVNNASRVWTESSAAADESAAGFRNRVRNAICGIIADYDLEYHGDQFSFSGSSSRLEGSEAEECIEKSREFVNELSRKLKGTMNDALEDVYRKCMSCSFSKSVLDPYISQLEDRKKDLEKPMVALENLKRIKKEVEAIR